MDVIHEETEKEILRLKRRLATEYKQAEKELKQTWAKYTKRFEVQDKEKAKQVTNGALSPSDYLEWRKSKILGSDALKQQIDRMSDYIINADQQSADIVNGERYGVYANNYNYARYEVEKGFHIDTSFSLFDQKTVERLAKDNPKMLPTVSPDRIKGKKWSKRAINNAISQGVLQGKSLPEVAKNLERVVGMEWNSAVRNARTAMTGAQNAGRVASYMDAEKLGINLQKQWVATLDERTRSSHASMDGESVPVDKKFSNKLMFPADPEGRPAEVYNCRCTMIADLVDYPRNQFQRIDNINGVPIDYVSYSEWASNKNTRSTASSLAGSLAKVEREDRMLSYERGAVLGRDGTVIARYDGKEHSVEVSDEDLKQMDGKIFTHNHPSGGFFSDADILTGFVKTNLHELRASTPQGIVYSLRNNGASQETAKKFLAEYSQAAMKANRTAQEHFIRKVKMGELSLEEYKKNYYKLYTQYRDEQLIKMAKQKASDYGFIFEVIQS